MVLFATTNEEKVKEAKSYLGDIVTHFPYDYAELQSDSLSEIAIHGANEAFNAAGGEEPVITDDSGIFIDALKGFPGPYSSYAYHTLGLSKILRLLSNSDNNRAYFRTSIAYRSSDISMAFEGSIRGKIVPQRGEMGFGYDPIFEYNGKTLAEMNTEEKNSISHRGRALSKLTSWLAEDSVEHRGVK